MNYLPNQLFKGTTQMLQQEYTDTVKRTESPYFHTNKVSPRTIHGIMGISTEAGELLDALKKTLFYADREIDVTNIKEELGDIAWYVHLLMDELKLDWNEILTVNDKKLRARFPEKFTTEHALVRDLDRERQILEGILNE